MGTGELLGKPDEMQGGGEPCDGLVSYPGGSCYYPRGFMLRKQGQPPARRAIKLKYRLFLLPMTVPLISQGNSKIF